MTNTSWLSSFDERKEQENQQYNIVIDFFEKSWFEVKDVHNDPKYFSVDIDLLIYNDWKEISVEVKFDDYMYRTNNFFFEIVSNEQLNTKWCFLKSEADILLYYDKINHIWYFLPMAKTQEWFFDIRKDYNSQNIKRIDENDFRLKSTHTHEHWVYHHTTIWRLADKDKVLKSLNKKGIPYYIKNILSEKILVMEVDNLLS